MFVFMNSRKIGYFFPNASLYVHRFYNHICTNPPTKSCFEAIQKKKK